MYTYIFKIRAFLGCRTCTAFGDTRWMLVPVSLPNPVLTRHQTSWRRVRSTTKHRYDNSNHDIAFDICFCSFANTYNNQIRQISLSLYHPFNGVFFFYHFGTHLLPTRPFLSTHLSSTFLHPSNRLTFWPQRSPKNCIFDHHIHWSIRTIAVPFSIWKYCNKGYQFLESGPFACVTGSVLDFSGAVQIDWGIWYWPKAPFSYV